MDNLKKYAVEGIVSLWLIIVAVQYLSRYFLRIDPSLNLSGNSLDVFTLAYIGMACLTVVTVGIKLPKAIRSEHNENS